MRYRDFECPGDCNFLGGNLINESGYVISWPPWLAELAKPPTGDKRNNTNKNGIALPSIAAFQKA